MLDGSVIEFARNNWGDLCSATGLLVGIIAFFVMLVQILAAKSSSDLARIAAEDVKRRMSTLDIVRELARACQMMEEVKRLHRAETWPILPDRYQSIRHALTEVREAPAPFDQDDRTTITAVISQFSEMERRVEKTNNTSMKPPSIPNLNEIVSEQLSAIHELLAKTKSKLEV